MRVFPNQAYGKSNFHHINLPLWKLEEFDFWRVIGFHDKYYGKTISSLHSGNLRSVSKDNRYSQLFQTDKVSYWSSSKENAIKEFRFHNKEQKNVLLFHSYDDATSTFPTIETLEPLLIVDGREFGFDEILEKFENNIELTTDDKELCNKIYAENPDALAYKSKEAMV